jgi:hypothetical protein
VISFALLKNAKELARYLKVNQALNFDREFRIYFPAIPGKLPRVILNIEACVFSGCILQEMRSYFAGTKKRQKSFTVFLEMNK